MRFNERTVFISMAKSGQTFLHETIRRHQISTCKVYQHLSISKVTTWRLPGAALALGIGAGALRVGAAPLRGDIGGGRCEGFLEMLF